MALHLHTLTGPELRQLKTVYSLVTSNPELARVVRADFAEFLKAPSVALFLGERRHSSRNGTASEKNRAGLQPYELTRLFNDPSTSNYFHAVILYDYTTNNLYPYLKSPVRQDRYSTVLHSIQCLVD